MQVVVFSAAEQRANRRSPVASCSARSFLGKHPLPLLPDARRASLLNIRHFGEDTA